jgi:hypothetical protein
MQLALSTYDDVRDQRRVGGASPAAPSILNTVAGTTSPQSMQHPSQTRDERGRTVLSRCNVPRARSASQVNRNYRSCSALPPHHGQFTPRKHQCSCVHGAAQLQAADSPDRSSFISPYGTLKPAGAQLATWPTHRFQQCSPSLMHAAADLSNTKCST